MKTAGNSQEKSWMKVSKTQEDTRWLHRRFGSLKNIFEAIDQIHSKKNKKKKEQ